MSTIPWTGDYIRESIELHLFWARVLKEHLIFLLGGSECKNTALIQEAEVLKCQIEEVLRETICLANGRVSVGVLHSGELFTDKTLRAERKMQELSGIAIATDLTVEEMQLQPYMGGGMEALPFEPGFEETVSALNEKALACALAKCQFYERIYGEVVKCCLFTHNHPTMYSHQIAETKLYMKLIQRLQCRQIVDPTFQMVETEMFWNTGMKGHAQLVRQLFDPSEEEMILKADTEVKKFKRLEMLFQDTLPRHSLKQITGESIKATEEIKNFKAVSTELILECQLKSLVTALLGDHILREAYYYLRLLKMPLPEFHGGRG